MLLVKTLLQRMQIAVLLQPFNGHDLASIGLYRKHGTGFGGLAIDKNCACSTGTGVAADVRTGQPKHITNPVDEQRARFDITFIGGSIDCGTDMMSTHLFTSCGACKRFAQRANCECAHHTALVFGGTTRIASGLRSSCGKVGSLVNTGIV